MLIKEKVVNDLGGLIEVIRIETDTDKGIFIDIECMMSDETHPRNNQRIKLDEKAMKKLIKVYEIAKEEAQERHDEARAKI